MRRSCRSRKSTRAIRSFGGKHVTIGADAHCTENIASGVEEAMELLSDIGCKEYTVFVERKPVQVPIE